MALASINHIEIIINYHFIKLKKIYLNYLVLIVNKKKFYSISENYIKLLDNKLYKSIN